LSGSSRVPFGGFTGGKKVTLNNVGSDQDRLPVAHTCYYELDLPKYETKEVLKEKLIKAVFMGKEGFFIA